MVVAADTFSFLLCQALRIYWVIMLVRVVLSWLELAGVHPPPAGPLRAGYELLYDVTEPILKQLRRIIPPVGMFDISVIVAFVIILVLQAVFC
ncbi:MAG: YggT family protein [Actinomycetota bacterium]|nr:YggT family protein [Actinomycetota bacterium]